VSRVRAAIVVAAVVLAATGVATAGDDDVDPDRPSVSSSARTVPAGAVQIETGFEYARTSTGAAPTERRLGVETLGRFGALDGLEIQLGWEPLVRLRGADDDTGIGDVTLSLKYQLLKLRQDSPWPSLGVLPFVKLPAAEEPIGSGRADFGVIGLASFDLPGGLGLDLNAGIAAIGQSRPRGHLIQALTAATLSVELDAAAPFVEIFHASRGERGGRDRVGLDAGVVYRVTKRVALDAAVETSLAGDGPDWAVRAGVSVRFGR
jgi:hypothetical protein